MPNWNDPQSWDNAYGLKGGFPGQAGYGQNLSYLDGRSFAIQLADDGQGGLASFRFKLQKLGASGINPAAETLIIGCGFGWLLEVIVDVGSNAVWGCDISTLIQGSKTDPQVDVRADIQDLILNVDFTAVDAANQFNVLGAGTNKGEFRNLVTENLLEDWPIIDIDIALDACDNLRAAGQSEVYHLITAQDALSPESSDPTIVINKLNLSEWVSLRPAHFWIDIVTGNVGGGV